MIKLAGNNNANNNLSANNNARLFALATLSYQFESSLLN